MGLLLAWHVLGGAGAGRPSQWRHLTVRAAASVVFMLPMSTV